MLSTLGIIEYFDSAHHLPDHPKCGSPHGHTYRVEMTVSGQVPENGMLLDFAEMKKSLLSILGLLDHRDLNIVLDDIHPTVENICAWILIGLQEELPIETLDSYSIKVWEGEGKWASMSYIKDKGGD